MTIPNYHKIISRQAARITFVSLACVAGVYGYSVEYGLRFRGVSLREHLAFFLMGVLVPLGGLALAVMFSIVGQLLRSRPRTKLALLFLFALLPVASGAAGYLVERSYAWKYYRDDWLLSCLQALPLIWIAVLCGQLCTVVIRLFLPQSLAFTISAKSVRSARRHAAIVLGTLSGCYVFSLAAPGARECMAWWLKNLGPRYLPPDGERAAFAIYQNIQVFASIAGPAFIIAVLQLAVYWRDFPLEHVVVARAIRRRERQEATACKS